tara:strand:+ start:26 stop:721 length:696 start_codon:yes stop_codon:yes gene_type:complete
MKKLKKTLLVLALIFISVSVIAGPTRPGLIRISKVGHDRATIEWKPSSHEERITYEVNLRIRKGERPTEWAFHDGCCLTRETSVTIDGLKPETKYEVRIIAWSAGGSNSQARMKEHAFTTLPQPVLYQRITSIPTGFSMISIPFKYKNNTVKDLFGTLKNIRYLTIYKFQIYDDASSSFVISSYDRDFKEWDNPKMVLEAGQAIWVLNTGKEYTFIPFNGYIPNNWRRLSD